jgi:hypothetical protein
MQNVNEEHDIERVIVEREAFTVELDHGDERLFPDQDIDSFHSHIRAQLGEPQSKAAVSASHIKNPRSWRQQLRNPLCEFSDSPRKNKTVVHFVQ